MKVDCVDISTWNSSVDYRAMKRDGIVAAILRAGYGREVSQIDSQFENHYKGCRDAGIKIGVYWYSYADGVDDAEKEARACLAVLNGRKLDLPVYFDMEESRQTSYGKTKLTAMAKRFCETIERGGYRAGVYSNLNWFNNYLDYSYLKSRYSVWLAQWASSYSLACDIWQNSDAGDISGISGNCDTDIIINRKLLDGDDPVIGDKDIKKVQEWLNREFKLKIAVDGIYGPETRTALIKALQTVLNRDYCARLEVDGIFGWRTKSAIRNLERGDYGDYVKVLQGFLICLGYDTGGFDGDFGRKTESAVRTFQEVNGLYADGIAGPYTFEALSEA